MHAEGRLELRSGITMLNLNDSFGVANPTDFRLSPNSRNRRIVLKNSLSPQLAAIFE
jgi:hypothetical protein